MRGDGGGVQTRFLGMGECLYDLGEGVNRFILEKRFGLVGSLIEMIRIDCVQP